MKRLSQRRLLLASAALLGLPVQAQAYPSKPVTLIVPQSPGGTNDAVARIVAQALTERLGQAALVENRPGAGGNIGAELVARAPRDGYTLMLTVGSTLSINPALYRKIAFDPVKDFEPIAPIGVVPNVLVVHPDFPAKNLAEFLRVAKAHQPPYQYASAGNGTINHLLGAMLNNAAGLQLVHIPYKGIAPAMTDVIGGQVPMAFASLPSCVEYIRSGRLRALGVSSPRRSAAAPDVPAIGEALPGFAGELWIGVLGVAGTPAPIIQRLAADLTAVVANPAVLEKFKAIGVEPLSGGPSALSRILKDDIERWAPIVRKSGAVVD